jgi:hypothetical protein
LEALLQKFFCNETKFQRVCQQKNLAANKHKQKTKQELATENTENTEKETTNLHGLTQIINKNKAGKQG